MLLVNTRVSFVVRGKVTLGQIIDNTAIPGSARVRLSDDSITTVPLEKLQEVQSTVVRGICNSCNRRRCICLAGN